MSATRRKKGRSAPRKRPAQPRLATINRAHAAQIRESEERDQREQKKRLYPEPEERGRYRP